MCVCVERTYAHTNQHVQFTSSIYRIDIGTILLYTHTHMATMSFSERVFLKRNDVKLCISVRRHMTLQRGFSELLGLTISRIEEPVNCSPKTRSDWSIKWDSLKRISMADLR